MQIEKHGGQLSEGPAGILVCIVDDSYGKPNDLDETVLYDEFKTELEEEFEQSFEEVDVAPGYSVPAFATLIQAITDYWPYLIATFFLAKPVSENLDVWISIAKSIRKYFVRSDIVLGRNAAAVLALEAVIVELGEMPKSIMCNGYYWTDIRFEGEELGEIDKKSIQDGPRTEYLCMAKQIFRIEADGINFEVSVEGKSVSAKRIKQSSSE